MTEETFKIVDKPPRTKKGDDRRLAFALAHPGQWFDAGPAPHASIARYYKHSHGFDAVTRLVEGETHLFLRYMPPADGVVAPETEGE
jgi:hypothetical protein